MRLQIAAIITMAAGCTGTGRCESYASTEYLEEWAGACPADTGSTPCKAACRALQQCIGQDLGGSTRLSSCSSGEAGTECTFDVTPTCEGRPPPGLVPFRSRARSPLRRWAATAAWMEAASVPAFLRLADELRSHGAPALAARARAAAADEVRHAHAIARAFGVRVPRVRLAPVPPRDLDALAVDNAIAGCAGETYGAAVACHQAHHAEARWRPMFARIAADETRHAQLAWDIQDWLGARARPDLVRVPRAGTPIPGLGLPGPEVGRRLAVLLA